MKKYILLVIVCLIGYVSHSQQLPLYSQYSWNDYIINPAFTGSHNYNPLQLTYRKQWVGFNGSPELFTLGGHTRLNDKIAIGGLVFKDNTGGAITQTGLLFNYCYRVKLNHHSYLGMALTANFNQYTFDNNKVLALTPGDPSLQDGVEKSLSPDASFGLLYQHANGFKIGLGINQLFESRLSNFSNTAENTLARHYNFNLIKSIKLDSVFVIEPSLLLKKTAASPIQADLMTRVIFKEFIWLGLSYRYEDAIIAHFGLQHKGMFIGYSYDATMSAISSYVSGSHELVLGLRIGNTPQKSNVDTDNDGVVDALDKCPTIAGLLENGGCPWVDSDKDGIEDSMDKCPTIFGNASNNGCPPQDKDGDNTPDAEDECPNTKGDSSNKGCPVVTNEQKAVVSKAITSLEFEFNKATIKQESYLGLDMLSILLSEKPDWKLKLAGHTDDVGTDASNLQLSKDRAESVKNYLVSKGIDVNRLYVEFYGKSKPVSVNTTEEGRKQNRRVEMTFVFE